MAMSDFTIADPALEPLRVWKVLPVDDLIVIDAVLSARQPRWGSVSGFF
jgi:hypothetical protein